MGPQPAQPSPAAQNGQDEARARARTSSCTPVTVDGVLLLFIGFTYKVIDSAPTSDGGTANLNWSGIPATLDGLTITQVYSKINACFEKALNNGTYAKQTRQDMMYYTYAKFRHACVTRDPRAPATQEVDGSTQEVHGSTQELQELTVLGFPTVLHAVARGWC